MRLFPDDGVESKDKRQWGISHFLYEISAHRGA